MAETAGMALTQWSPSSMAIQIVLYNDSVEGQMCLAGGLSATIAYARAAFDLDRVVVRYGDCSRWPCLAEDDEVTLRSALGESVDEVTFTYFDANLGSSGGSNELACLGDEDVIWVLNPDTYPSPMAGAELLDMLRKDDVAAT